MRVGGRRLLTCPPEWAYGPARGRAQAFGPHTRLRHRSPRYQLGRLPGTLGGVKTFDSLFQELLERRDQRPEGSSTVALLDGGVHAIGKKVVEEASEVWMAAEHESAEDLALEISQLIYHLQVLMVAKGVSPQDVYDKL